MSQAVGERCLLPFPRAASNDTITVADGFGYREHMRHATRRQALHVGQMLARH